MTERDYDKLKRIEDAIKAFDGNRLYESSVAFFHALDYHSEKTGRLSPATYEGFLEDFSIPKNSLNPEKALTDHWRRIEFIFQVADAEITRVQSLFDTGKVDRNEYQSFLFFTIHLKEESYKRGDLVKITREINIPFKMPVIVLFHYGNKLTLSIIDRRLHKKDTSKDVLEKVTLIKDIDITNPQRAHKEILKDLSLNELYQKFEFHSFVKLHEAWKATLNISELNKRFYREIFNWYLWASKWVKFPQVRPEEDLISDEIHKSESLIRLLTRLMFCWFMKERGLISDHLFEEKMAKKILLSTDPEETTYYLAILQNLFFATLNQPIEKRKQLDAGWNKSEYGDPLVYRHRELFSQPEKMLSFFEEVPFLNGGLFDCLDQKKDQKHPLEIRLDGFSSKKSKQPIVPNKLFFSDYLDVDLSTEYADKKKTKVKVRGLINTLSSYKFTIEENTPVEEEIALDPELLGKVFENLLASYNPETQTTARKLTGSFYTPREIVDYMVDVSLINYLKTKLPNGSDKEIELRKLFDFKNTSSKSDFTSKEKEILLKAIHECRILDPACGSGAFPMGVLQKMIHVLKRLDPENSIWLEMVVSKFPEYMQGQMREKLKGESWDYVRKIGIIQDCIYGIDIQPIAIQISKLRFFIALLVDQEEKPGKPNRGFDPLPNLDFKLIAANTLIAAPKSETTGIGLFADQKDVFQEKLKSLTTKYFNTHLPDAKKALKEEIEKLVDSEVKDKISRIESTYKAEDKRIEKALKESKKAVISQKQRDVTLWNSYSRLFKHEAVGFFDIPYFFPQVEKGFNIILGNPPYVSANNMSIHERNYFNESKQYTTLKGKWDLYIAFTERSLKLLTENGIFTFIIPFGFLNQPFAEEIRKLILKDFSLLSIVDMHNNKIFESATVPSCIPLIARKRSSSHNVSILEFNNDLFNEKHRIHISRYLETTQNMFRTENLEVISELLKDIQEKGIPLDTHFYVSTGAEIHGKESRDDEGNTISGTSKFDVLKDRFSEGLKPYIEGSAIEKSKDGRYSFPKIDSWLDYSNPSEMRSPKFKELFDSEKLIVRGSSGLLRILAIHDDRKIYTSHKCLLIIPREKLPKESSKSNPENEIDLKYLLGIINSRLIDFYYESVYGGFIDVYPNNLKELPIILAEKEKREIIVDLVNYLISLKKNENRDSQNRIVCQQFDRIIDGCVYELYFGKEMKESGVNILDLVKLDLKSVENLASEKATFELFEKWQEPENEVRNRLLLMATRCPDTIGIIESTGE